MKPDSGYRSKQLLVLDDQMNLGTTENNYFAVQSLPIFMQEWALNAANQKGNNNVITSTVNVTQGCPIGVNSLCGQYCFAHRSWDGSTVRSNTAENYLTDMQRLRSQGKNISLFLSTDTEPVPSNERISNVTYNLLKAMTQMPPHGLIIHSHTDRLGETKFLDVLKDINYKTNLVVGLGFDTDSDRIPKNYPGHDTSVKDRVKALEVLASSGIKVQASFSPMLGFEDFQGFSKRVHELGAYRVMVGELRTSFEKGGSEKAKGLDLGLFVPTEQEAISFLEQFNFPGGVKPRDQFYVLLAQDGVK